MDQPVAIGLDLARSVFRLHGIDGGGRIVPTDRTPDWLDRMLASKPVKLVAIALAARMARTVHRLRAGDRCQAEPAAPRW